MTPIRVKKTEVQSIQTYPLPVKELELLLSNKLTKVLGDKKLLSSLTNALKACAALDHESDLASLSLGRFCFDVLYKDPTTPRPLEEQEEITTTLAKAMGIDPPTYKAEGRGRPTMGRDQLASLIYYAFPSDLIKEGKDSKAGKRITDHVARYRRKLDVGNNPSSAPRKSGPAKFKKTFQALYAHCTREEGVLLLRLFQRMGIELPTLDKWSGKHLLENIINVTPLPPSNDEGEGEEKQLA